MPTIITLADHRRATGGPCSICGQPATKWSRSGRRDTNIDGLVLAVRSCDVHEADADAGMSALDAAQVAALIPRSKRALRATTARRHADRLRGYSNSSSRASASLIGGSSLTHKYGLMGDYHAMVANAYDALADALEALTP